MKITIELLEIKNIINENKINGGLDTAEKATRKLKSRLKEKYQVIAQRGKKMDNIKGKFRNMKDSIIRTSISIISIQREENMKNGENTNSQN